MPNNIRINNRVVSTLQVGDVIAQSAYYGSSEVFIAPEDDFDPDAATYIAAVESADGQTLEEGVKQAIDGFVTGCKADGIWDAIKASCILAGARTLNGALVPLVGDAPTNFNFVSADYDRVTGLKGDGSTKYLNANRNNNADPQDNNHNSVFLTELGTTDAYTIISAGTGSNNGTNVISGFQGGFSRNRSARGTTHGTAFTTGLAGVSRLSSASYTVRAAGVNETISETSDGVLSADLTVYRRLGSPSNYSNMRAFFYSAGEAVDLAALDARVSTLMNNITFAVNTGLNPLEYDSDTVKYINAGYEAGGTLA